MERRRGIASILAVATACLLAAGIGLYCSAVVLDERAFADRAASTLRSDEVQEEVAARIVAGVEGEQPSLTLGEPLLEDAAGVVAASPEYRAAFRAGAARLHRALVEDPDAEAALGGTGTGAALGAVIAERYPAVARRVRGLADPPLLTVGQHGSEQRLRRALPVAAGLVLPVSIGIGLAGLALLALAIAREPRRGIWGAGLAVAAAGGLAAAGVTAAGDLALTSFDTDFGDAVVSAVWTAYFGDLRAAGLAVGAAGLVVAAAAGAPRLDPRTALTPPATRGGRLARAVALLGAAALAVEVPELVLHAGLVALAAALVYVAARDLLRVLAPPASAARPARAAVTAAALVGLIAVAAPMAI